MYIYIFFNIYFILKVQLLHIKFFQPADQLAYLGKLSYYIFVTKLFTATKN